MAEKRSVGLVVLTEIPGIGPVAVLQRRGEFNHEKMGPESFPGACQVTCHGKVEEGEDQLKALFREIREELGEDMEALLSLALAGNKMLIVSQEQTEEKIVSTWAAIVGEEFFDILRLGPSTGGLRLVRKEDVENIQILDLKDPDQKRDGVTDRRVTAMFADEKRAIKRAFALFSIPSPTVGNTGE